MKTLQKLSIVGLDLLNKIESEKDDIGKHVCVILSIINESFRPQLLLSVWRINQTATANEIPR